MKISRKSRFAISALIRLGLGKHSSTKTLAELSIDQGISLSYLEQLFALLRQGGIVTGIRGPGGGYRLAKEPEDISIASIINAVDPDAYTPHMQIVRETDAMWARLSARLYDFLDGASLADVLDRKNTDYEDAIFEPARHVA